MSSPWFRYLFGVCARSALFGSSLHFFHYPPLFCLSFGLLSYLLALYRSFICSEFLVDHYWISLSHAVTLPWFLISAPSISRAVLVVLQQCTCTLADAKKLDLSVPCPSILEHPILEITPVDYRCHFYAFEFCSVGVSVNHLNVSPPLIAPSYKSIRQFISMLWGESPSEHLPSECITASCPSTFLENGMETDQTGLFLILLFSSIIFPSARAIMGTLPNFSTHPAFELLTPQHVALPHRHLIAFCGETEPPIHRNSSTTC